MSDALKRFLEALDVVGPALVDSYFVVDAERRIVHSNRAFRALLPRSAGKSLEGKKCHELLQLEICGDRCIAEACWRGGRPVRLDEIGGRPGGEEGRERRFILSALPITAEDGTPVGALEIQRDVTDAALVQEKYQALLDSESRERERLAAQIRARTRELLETNQLLEKTQKELLAYKKGLLL